MADPFDPDVVAQGRIAAYAKATVMKFLDNLIAWGDCSVQQYTAETVSQAEQLYILADMILGPQPQELRLPSGLPGDRLADHLRDAPGLGNRPIFRRLVNIENVIVTPTPPQAVVDGTANMPTLPYLPLATAAAAGPTATRGRARARCFCIPPNGKLLAYWGTVAQRLYNIRHCLNMQGVPQPLPMYGPPLNPLQLERGARRCGKRLRRIVERADLSVRDLSATGGRADERRSRLWRVVLAALEKRTPRRSPPYAPARNSISRRACWT